VEWRGVARRTSPFYLILHARSLGPQSAFLGNPSMHFCVLFASCREKENCIQLSERKELTAAANSPRVTKFHRAPRLDGEEGTWRKFLLGLVCYVFFGRAQQECKCAWEKGFLEQKKWKFLQEFYLVAALHLVLKYFTKTCVHTFSFPVYLTLKIFWRK